MTTTSVEKDSLMSTTLEQPTQQAMTIRVVIDGAPKAGKSTAMGALSRVIGSEVVTPNEAGQPSSFEWMSYDGGFYEGEPIRVEMATVPASKHLTDQRRHLLTWGDVVVFVADTTEAGLGTSQSHFNRLRVDLSARVNVPIVVVANKRDLIDVVPMTYVRDWLGLAAEDWLVEGVADSGSGIQEALIYAVRSVLAESPVRRETTMSDDLLAQLQAYDPVSGATLTAANVDDDAADPAVEPRTTDKVHACTATSDVLRLRGVRLNPNEAADGGGVIITPQHWRLLVEIAHGRSEISFADPDDAATALELATWGLITCTQSTDDKHGSAAPDPLDPAAEYRAFCELRQTMEVPPGWPKSADSILTRRDGTQA